MEKESQVFLQTKQILRVQSQRRIRLELITKTRTNYGRAIQQQSPKSIVAQQCVEDCQALEHFSIGVGKRVGAVGAMPDVLESV